MVLLFFYYSFFITRFLYLFLKVTAFFKVVGSNPGWGNFFIFFYFSIIFSIKNCVENIKGTFYSNFINTWFQVISNYYYLKSIVKWTLNKNCLLCFQHSFWWRIWWKIKKKIKKIPQPGFEPTTFKKQSLSKRVTKKESL